MATTRSEAKLGDEDGGLAPRTSPIVIDALATEDRVLVLVLWVCVSIPLVLNY